MTTDRGMQYSQPTGTPLISHLSFADDIIIFSNGSKNSLQKLMGVLNDYQGWSGQLLNTHKCTFTTSNKVHDRRNNNIKQITGFCRQEAPITYLGCPIFHGRAKLNYFQDLISRIRNRVQGWHTNLLNQAGKLILIAHVLQSMPIYICAAILPPGSVLREIDKLMKNCFWNDKDNIKHHWIAWDNCCKLKEEGGIGIKRMADTVHVQSLKVCWKLISEESLWGKFMKAKYIKEINNPAYRYTKVSTTWKRIRTVRGEAVQYVELRGQNYAWKLSQNGMFNAKATWQHIREKENHPYSYKFIWGKYIPNRISIFMWKLLHNRIPLDDKIQSIGIQLASKCKCCIKGDREDVHHLFFRGDIAKDVWKHFTDRVGFRPHNHNLSTFLKSWWRRANGGHEEMITFLVLPIVICWNIWKSRNRCFFDDVKMSLQGVVENVNWEIRDLIKSEKFGDLPSDSLKTIHDILN